MSEHRITALPIVFRLSPELLGIVFYYSVVAGHFHCHLCMIYCPLNAILAVCRTWRRTALGYSFLWSPLCACITEDTRRLDWYLAHSQACPISLIYSIRDDHPCASLSQVLPLLPKAVSFRLAIDEYSMDVEDLVDRFTFLIVCTSTIDQIFTQHLPHLRHLELSWTPNVSPDETLLGVKLLDLRVADLQSLTLDGILIASQDFYPSFFPRLKRLNIVSVPEKPVLSLGTLFRILDSLTTIEVLILDEAFVTCLADINIRLQVPVRMPHLRVIWIRDYLSHILPLFDHLRAPLLMICNVWAAIEATELADSICSKVECLVGCDTISRLRRRLSPDVVDIAFQDSEVFSIEWASQRSTIEHFLSDGEWAVVPTPHLVATYDANADMLSTSNILLSFAMTSPTRCSHYDYLPLAIEGVIRSFILQNRFITPVRRLSLRGMEHALAPYIYGIPSRNLFISSPSNILPSWILERPGKPQALTPRNVEARSCTVDVHSRNALAAEAGEGGQLIIGDDNVFAVNFLHNDAEV